MAGTPLSLIVGLGNPGAEHQKTCHNAGFWFVDALADRTRAVFRSDSKFHGAAANCALGGRSVWLLKPMTYMNRSGLAVSAFVNYFKIDVAEVLVAYDELDLPPGTARLKFGGGHAGHNGMRDVIAHVGDGFWRLRLGIGHPGDKNQVIDHVLDRPNPEEERAIRTAIGEGLDSLPVLIEHGGERAMNQLHRRTPLAETPAEPKT
ncbi:MAG: aminoacyl-tRNA hydrolase [Steroidobacterales bacterium]